MTTAPTYENVLLSVAGGVATVTLNRPDVLNALSPALVRDLTQALRYVADNEDIRAVVLTGAGRSFCAGGDMQEDVSVANEWAAEEYLAVGEEWLEVTTTIVGMEKPVIAAIRGHAVGGGFEISLACDIRIAAETARLGNAFIRMGVVADLGGVYFLPRLVGLGKAKLLALTGDFIGAAEAERMGVVELVVPDTELERTARELAEKLAKGPTKAIGMTKKAMHRALGTDLATAARYCCELNVSLLQTADHREAFTAFLEKRRPDFKGR